MIGLKSGRYAAFPFVCGLGAALFACGFEDAKSRGPETSDVALGPFGGRWCGPGDRVGGWEAARDDAGTVTGHAVLRVGARTLSADWAAEAEVVDVVRRLDGVVFEHQRWELDANATLLGRSVETPNVLSAADRALVEANALDDHQALRGAEPWAHALVTARGGCDVLPSAYGHGYPQAEGWYAAGALVADAVDVAADITWYGHGGEGAGAPFSPDRSLVIAIRYDDAERMVEERLDRGASDGGPHDLLRERTFGEDGALVIDRIERWSPTPKEDIVRVLRFAVEGPATLRRELADTWDATLDVRWIARPR